MFYIICCWGYCVNMVQGTYGFLKVFCLDLDVEKMNNKKLGALALTSNKQWHIPKIFVKLFKFRI